MSLCAKVAGGKPYPVLILSFIEVLDPDPAPLIGNAPGIGYPLGVLGDISEDLPFDELSDVVYLNRADRRIEVPKEAAFVFAMDVSH